MNQAQIREGIRLYLPALTLDRVMGKRLRDALSTGFFALVIICAAAVVASMTYVPQLYVYEPFIRGALLIAASLWLIVLQLSAFHDSYYYRDVRKTLKDSRRHRVAPMTFAVAEMVSLSDPADATGGFLRSPFGKRLMMRLGVSAGEVWSFIGRRRSSVAVAGLAVSENATVNMLSYLRALFEADSELSEFLFALDVQEDDFLGAVDWLSNMEAKKKRRARPWSRDNLGRIPGIGKSWAYGRTYHLDRYGEELSGGVMPADTGVVKEVEELEAALTSARGANALIVADAGSGETDIIYGLVGMIEQGIAFPQLEGKRVFRLDTVGLIDNSEGKIGFENTLIQVMNEAVKAGNVIVVIEDLPGFVENAASIGSDIVQILQPYLRSSRAQIIATADRARFHEVIERRSALVNAFELIRVAEKDASAMITILENFVPNAEAETGTLYTYQAVRAVAEAAVRFFTDVTPLTKARDLLFEVPTITVKAGRVMVTKDDVMSFVEMKTGIPQEGNIKAGEEDKLLNLEALLHERVIGQDEAIGAVANAMRRARAGLRNTERPIGSFLFLGPTGVGKTETAKALDEIFFGTAAPMLRLDMSEYSGGDALMRLIGFSGGQPGVLASMLRDQKYGVLLLDEFEKTTPEVMNLFLQVLDEGFFSDADGKKVNARNLIVIATSNAGSDEIFRLAESGKDLASEKDSFVDALISRGYFKAELLNRFDGVIIFHPLSRESLKEVAVLVARKFAKQLKTQGMNLTVTDDLLDYLAEKGYDPKFGARPMNRVLQEKAEKLVAEAVIARKVRRGATIALVRSASNPDELEIRAG